MAAGTPRHRRRQLRPASSHRPRRHRRPGRHMQRPRPGRRLERRLLRRSPGRTGATPRTSPTGDPLAAAADPGAGAGRGAVAGLPMAVLGARRLPGREPAEAGLPDGDRVEAARGVGRLRPAPHDPALVPLGAGVLPIDPLGRGDRALRAARARQRLDRLVRAGAWRVDPAVEDLLARAERLGPDLADRRVRRPTRAVPAGRRPRARGRGYRLGDLCLADPAVDLSLAYGGFGGRVRRRYWSSTRHPAGP
jgi:hypothetical protein